MTPGELRRSQNWIGPAGATLAEATFVPPPPDLVPEGLSQLDRFLRAGDAIPVLIKVGMAPVLPDPQLTSPTPITDSAPI